MGAQDSFDQALDFLDDTGVATPDMLYDPTFVTWQSFGIRTNSQMQLLTPDLTSGSDLLFGFSDDQQQAILQALDAFTSG